MNALRDFFTPDAGQARTNWLNNVLQTYVADPVNYYLGPSGVPNKLQAVGNALEFTDAGDMPAAADAGRRLWNDPSIGNAAEYAAAGAAMMLPMYSARMGEGIANLADDARFLWADEEGALNLDLLRSKYPGAQIDVTGNPSRGYTVNRIVVPEGRRESGTGTAIMQDIMRQADIDGATVSLTPSGDFGGNVSRLRQFYEGLGFTRNKGRNRDFSISEEMYRLPEPADPATERAQGILDLLTSGRASEVTDDMLDLGDPVQNARLNMYLFDNYDLPMDEASRMARAGDTDAFHATRSTENFSQFRPGARGSIYMAATPEGAAKGAAGQALEVAASNPVSGTTAIMPLRINSGDVRGLTVNQSAYDALPDVLTEGDIPAMAGRIRGAGLEYWDDAYEAVRFGDEYRYYKRDAPTARYQDLEPGKDAWGYRLGAFNAGSDLDSLERSAKMGKRGFMVADEGGSSIVAGIDMPIRSRFARFDPRLAHLRNLSAGLAGTGILAPALMQDDQGEIDAFLSENGY